MVGEHFLSRIPEDVFALLCGSIHNGTIQWVRPVEARVGDPAQLLCPVELLQLCLSNGHRSREVPIVATVTGNGLGLHSVVRGRIESSRGCCSLLNASRTFKNRLKTVILPLAWLAMRR